jgi:16S rRNA (uracil1498-N3)-methyltransferase
MSRNNMLRLSLGPRVLRADTAAVAALALIHAAFGEEGAASTDTILP